MRVGGCEEGWRPGSLERLSRLALPSPPAAPTEVATTTTPTLWCEAATVLCPWTSTSQVSPQVAPTRPSPDSQNPHSPTETACPLLRISRFGSKNKSDTAAFPPRCLWRVSQSEESAPIPFQGSSPDAGVAWGLAGSPHCPPGYRAGSRGGRARARAARPGRGSPGLPHPGWEVGPGVSSCPPCPPLAPFP